MGLSRRVYTRSDFLELSSLVRNLSLAPEAIEKFDVIELSDSTVAPLRRGIERNVGVRSENVATEAETVALTGVASAISGNSNTSASGNRSRGTDGSLNTHERRVNSNREDNWQPNQRFAPPPQGPWRGNRDQETFEEGIKYEMAQTAIHNEQLKEIIAKEAGETKEQLKRNTDSSNTVEEEKRSEEIDQLLKQAVSQYGTKKSTLRSRFFNSSSAQGQETGVPNTKIWSKPSLSSTQKDPEITHGIPSNESVAAKKDGSAIGGVSITGGVTNLSGSHAHNMFGSLVKPPQASTGITENGGVLPQSPAQTHIVRAEDLEQMLQSGKMPMPSTKIPSHKDFSFEKEKDKGVIQASELEMMLLRQARSVNQVVSNPSLRTAPMGASLSPLPAQQPSASTRTSAQMQQGVSTQAAPIGVMNLSAQPWMQVPVPQTQQGANPLLQHPAPPSLAGMKIPMQAHLAMSNGMSMPIMMNAQGQFIASTQAPFLLPGGHQHFMYRRPDGAVYMSAPPNMSALGNAQCLYMQPPQHQRH